MNARNKLRWRIAQEAARLIAEEGYHQYGLAKQKAAARLGVDSSRNLPGNEEIDQALEEHHRLYRAHIQPRHINRLRELALEAMRFLQAFSPRLVGGVLEGSAGEFSPITLHLFPDTAEEVMAKLMDGRIPFREKTVSLAMGPTSTDYPALYFFVDGVEIVLILLPVALMQQRPANARRARKSPRGDLEDVEAMVLRGKG